MDLSAVLQLGPRLWERFREWERKNLNDRTRLFRKGATWLANPSFQNCTKDSGKFCFDFETGCYFYELGCVQRFDKALLHLVEGEEAQEKRVKGKKLAARDKNQMCTGGKL